MLIFSFVCIFSIAIPVTFSSPFISRTWLLKIYSTLVNLESFSINILSAVRFSRFCITITFDAIAARSNAASIPEFPPPTTAAIFPAKRGASQTAQ